MDKPISRNSLVILDSTGDTKLTWDHSDPASIAEARATVSDLTHRGYTFFLVNGDPADEVTAGAGTLIVRKLTADEVVEDPGPSLEPGPSPDGPQAVDPVADPPKRRGRPPKSDRNVIAVRPVAGG